MKEKRLQEAGIGALHQIVAAKRYALENGGLVVEGMTIRTNAFSREELIDAYAYARANPAAWFKLAFVPNRTLTADQVIAIGDAVGSYVVACYEAEAAIYQDIAAGIITRPEQVDADPRWPKARRPFKNEAAQG